MNFSVSRNINNNEWRNCVDWEFVKFIFAWTEWNTLFDRNRRKTRDINEFMNEIFVSILDMKTTFEWWTTKECILFNTFDTKWDVDRLERCAAFECIRWDSANTETWNEDRNKISTTLECRLTDCRSCVRERKERVSRCRWE